jgi:hypothetical protein
MKTLHSCKLIDYSKIEIFPLFLPGTPIKIMIQGRVRIDDLKGAGMARRNVESDM